ncbi:hypothetical protein [Herbidospora sp. NBRC 101105]|uniref:hypothetical protein n=1 Tax=Herbidospora sp. NBRC 101105 TaxID=3032195 RepID=UPI0024A30A35|nr:hypothetical protein [Herbidospora sp. NBRC 101105]GLX94118.1 hypothetical protein Hesp01_20680 [Herbidospora sp. NBRC 101105]
MAFQGLLTADSQVLGVAGVEVVAVFRVVRISSGMPSLGMRRSSKGLVRRALAIPDKPSFGRQARDEAVDP